MAELDHEHPPKQSLVVKLLWQIAAAVVIVFLTDLIHYHVHSLRSVHTFSGALIVAVSFLPGVIIGYLIVWIQRKSGEEEPDVPVAGVICALLWFVYLFRALTILVGLPALSNWMGGPSDFLINGLEWLDPEKLGNWLLSLVGLK